MKKLKSLDKVTRMKRLANQLRALEVKRKTVIDGVEKRKKEFSKLAASLTEDEKLMYVDKLNKIAKINSHWVMK